MTAQDPLNLIWIDLEMTGLDPERERIIEIATVVTDANLNVLAEGPSLVVHQQDTLLDAMDDWNPQSARWLWFDSASAQQPDQRGPGLAQQPLIFCASGCQLVPLLCAATPLARIAVFWCATCPSWLTFFHYRNLDVSTLKELVRRWKPELENGFAKKGSHLAMDDVYDSIAELAYYREGIYSGLA